MSEHGSGRGTRRSSGGGALRLAGIVRKIVLAGVLGAVILPAAAHAAITPGGANGFGNTYGQVGGLPSDPASNVCRCHITQVLKYATTRHGADFTIADGDPAKIDPTLVRYWPTPTFGNSLRFMPQDIGWVFGAYSGPVLPPAGVEPPSHSYVLRKNLWGPPGTPVTVSTGSTFYAWGPADDVAVVSGLEFDHHEADAANPQGKWVNDSPVSVMPFFQVCGNCHALGVTKPANSTKTLGNGAQITPSTPTSWAALGVNCENCHGTGDAASAHGFTLPGVVGAVGGNVPKRALSSDVCGQCHVSGAAKETLLGNAFWSFSNPNGYTPDMTLAAFNVTNAAQGAYSSFTVRRLSMETTTNGRSTTYFYPDGHYKGSYNGTYNEWLESGHAKSLNTILKMFYLPNSVKATCLPCHSGEGYLASKGYKSGPFGLAMTSSPSKDKLGVECAVCHTIHDSAKGLGLRVDREELCQECHTAHIPAGQQATPGEEINGPVKEIVAGYGMIDVAPMAPFMPGAECPDCHMPKTYVGAKSHRFTAMLPGDAERWGVREKGDSCTPCHPKRSREALQADLDRWHDGVAAESAKALAAIGAAKARPTSMTPTGISLINRAYTNQTFTNDPGAASHNYPYMMAGLRKATAMARAVGGSVRLGAAGAAITRGGRAHLAGQARFGDGGAAAGETVVIEKKTSADAAWVPVATLACDAAGEFAVALAQEVNTQYRAYWQASGVDRIWAADTVSVGMATSLSIYAPARVRSGRRFAIRGYVSPPQSGQIIKVYVKAPGSKRFALLAKPRARTVGYALTYKALARGNHYFIASFAGTADVLRARSRYVRVVAR